MKLLYCFYLYSCILFIVLLITAQNNVVDLNDNYGVYTNSIKAMIAVEMDIEDIKKLYLEFPYIIEYNIIDNNIISSNNKICSIIYCKTKSNTNLKYYLSFYYIRYDQSINILYSIINNTSSTNIWKRLLYKLKVDTNMKIYELQY